MTVGTTEPEIETAGTDIDTDRGYRQWMQTADSGQIADRQQIGTEQTVDTDGGQTADSGQR